MSAADNLGNLFVALLAGIPLLIFVLFACCACLEASIQAARRSYKPHLPTRVRFADEAEEEEDNGRQRNPLLFGLTGRSSGNRGGPGHLEGSGLTAHSTYIQKFPNYRYSTVGQSPSHSTPPPVLKSRTEQGSGSLKSPVSPLSDTQRLLEREYGLVGSGLRRGTPTRSTPPKVGSPAAYPPKGILVSTSSSVSTATPPPPRRAGSTITPKSTCTPPPPRRAGSSSGFMRQGTSTTVSHTDTQSQLISEKSSPTLTTFNMLSYFDGSRRSSTSTPTTTPNFQTRPKSPFAFECCRGPDVDPQQQRRYSTPSSPTMYAYHYEQRTQTHSNYSSMSYLPEIRSYLNFMEEDMSNRQRSHSFSGRPTRRTPSQRSYRVAPYHVPSPRTPSPYTLELSQLDMEDEASKLSTPSSFETTFLTPPGSTDQGSFKSPESCTPDWLLTADIPPFRVTAQAVEGEEDGINYRQPLSRSCSIRTATI